MRWKSAWTTYACLLLTRVMTRTPRARRRAATVTDAAPRQWNCPVLFSSTLKAWSVQSRTIKISWSIRADCAEHCSVLMMQTCYTFISFFCAISARFITPFGNKKMFLCFYQTRSHSENDIRPRPKSCKILIYSVLLVLNPLQSVRVRNQFSDLNRLNSKICQ